MSGTGRRKGREGCVLGGESLTSAVQGAAAERGRHGRGWLLWLGLHNNLIALHEPLANELLKHLLGCHLHSFLIPPERRLRGLE